MLTVEPRILTSPSPAAGTGWRVLLVIAALLILPVAQYSATAQAATVIGNPALADDFDGTNWASYGRTYSEQHFSPLTQIHPDNISRLGLAWALDLDTASAMSTPLAVDGVLYLVAGASIVHAVDVQTGKLLWRYDPEVASIAGKRLRAGGIDAGPTRGIAFWKGKVYTATLDGRLIALDAHTGAKAWSVRAIAADDDLTISGAPRAFNGLVAIGLDGIAGSSGTIAAYDAESGRPVWRFHETPDLRGARAGGSVGGSATDSAPASPAGSSWGSIAYDPDFNLVHAGPGIALHADTGKLAWQARPGNDTSGSGKTGGGGSASAHSHAGMDMVLTELTIDGQRRKILLQATKNGLFRVIDRASGTAVSTERFARADWLERLDGLATSSSAGSLHSGKHEGRRGSNNSAPAIPRPGAHDWPPMSFNPITRLTYIPVMELSSGFIDKLIAPVTPATAHQASIRATGTAATQPTVPGTSHLLAWDAARQQEAWRAQTPGTWNGGTLTTAGNLVFQGLANGELRAYTAQRGTLVWTFRAGGPILGAPISYRAQGQQYLSVLVGPPGGWASGLGPLFSAYGWQYRVHPRRLLTFAIDARASLPATPEPQNVVPLDDPKFRPDARLIKTGADLYTAYCMACHGLAVISGGAAPDLRASTMTLSVKGFEDVVRNGLLEGRGMPKFGELSEAQREAIRHYIRAQAQATRQVRHTQ